MDAILHGVLVDFSMTKGLVNFFSVIFYFFHLSHTFLDFRVTRNIEIKTCGLKATSKKKQASVLCQLFLHRTNCHAQKKPITFIHFFNF